MRPRVPTTQALACFVAAARHQSFSRAADELALTQSAVSRQVQALEGFLGVALFRRTRHGMALTPAGARYARQAGQGLAALERDTLEAMADPAGAGSVHLAAVPTFATRWLLPRLAQRARSHPGGPGATVHIETRTRPFLFPESGFDAALYAGTPEQVAHWPGVRAERLMGEDVVPVAAPALVGRGGLAPVELARLPLLQQSTRPDGWRRWFAAVEVDAPAPLAGPRYELFSMLATAAAHGLGVALVPPALIEAELAHGELVVACARPLRGERAYYLVLPEGEPGGAAVEAFAAWLRAEAAAAAG